METIKTKTEKQIKDQAYNKKYYEKNRKQLISYLCEKQECNLCGKFVSRNRLNIHKELPICQRLRERKSKDTKILKELNNEPNNSI